MVRYQLHHHFEDYDDDNDDDDDDSKNDKEESAASNGRKGSVRRVAQTVSEDNEHDDRMEWEHTNTKNNHYEEDIDEVPREDGYRKAYYRNDFVGDDDGHDENESGDYDHSVKSDEEEDDDDPYCGRRGMLSNVLTRYRRPTTSLLRRAPTTTAIQEHHYHIYYTPPPEYYQNHNENDDVSRPNGLHRVCVRVLGSWWFVALLALGGQIIYNYGPPAPPLPLTGTASTTPILSTVEGEPVVVALSWPEFWNHQRTLAGKLLRTWGVELPTHVSFWCWQGIRNDFLNKYYTSSSWDEHQGNNNHGLADHQDCKWQPHLFTEENTSNQLAFHSIQSLQQNLKNHVVGQDQAIDMIGQVIMTRRKRHSSYSKLSLSPILMYLTGGVGVGKAHLAYALSRLVFSSSPFSQSDSHGNGCNLGSDEAGSQPIFIVDSMDHSDDSDEARIMQQIKDHATQAASSFGGAAVVLTHIEELRPTVFAQLVRTLASSGGFPSTASGSPNLLVIFTSNVGARVIQKTIQMYGGIAPIPPLELGTLLSYQVDLFHGTLGTNAHISTVGSPRKWNIPGVFRPSLTRFLALGYPL
jgi:hypothetical protein